MWKLFALLILFNLPFRALAEVQLHEARIEYDYFNDAGRDPLFQPESLKMHEGLGIGIDIDLWKGIRWDNLVSAVTDHGGYKSVQWELRFYWALSQNVELGYHHKSRHLLDQEGVYRFPVQDSFQFVWHLYTNPKPRDTLF